MFSSLVIWTVRDSCNCTTYFPLWEQAWLTWAYRGKSRCGRAECTETVSTHGHSSAGFTDWSRLDVSLPSVGTSCWREYWSYIYFQNPIRLKVWEWARARYLFLSSFSRRSSSSVRSHPWTNRLLLQLPCSDGESHPGCPFQTNQQEIGHIPLPSLSVASLIQEE